MIDLSERIIQTPTRPAKPALRLHPLRRAAQVLCGVLLVLLPLTNGLRLDIRAGTFYFLWHRMAAHDLELLCWAAMLGVWTMVTVSFLYGRVWCGTVCPQTLLSDFAVSVQARLDKACRRAFTGGPPGPSSLRGGNNKTQGSFHRGLAGTVRSKANFLAFRPPKFGGPGGPFLLSRTLWFFTLAVVAVGTGYVLACYWLAPHTVARAVFAPLSDPAAALTVYLIAAVVLGDMTFVRRRFCSHFCPYGALMSTLSDTKTLSARFLTERADECISCHKCETDCPMGIDIKQGVGQLSCIGCGECVDACNDVLGKRGVSGLIEFRYGTEPERATVNLTRAQKWGLWDGRRVGVGVTLLAFLAVTLWQVFGTRPLHATLAANGAITRTAEMASNTYTLTLSGGRPHGSECHLSVNGLPPGASVSPARVYLQARDTVNIPVTVTAPVARTGRQHITLHVTDGNDTARAPVIFYTPDQ